MKFTKILSLAALLVAGTVFSATAQDTTTVKKVHHHKMTTTTDTTMKHNGNKTHMHKKVVKDSTVVKP